MSAPWVEIKFVAKPWWTRFHKALELAIYGSIIFNGQIAELEEKPE